jgi:DNA-binding CsgD family transcriptional regulator
MTEEYDLKKSSEGQLKQLYPILLDAHGNVIDGFHRKEVDEKWPTITLGHIDNTVKLELARLASNFCRRNVPPEELEQKIGFLIGSGLTVQEIVDQTGISERTIYRHMPEQLKKPEAKTISEAMREKVEVAKGELTPVSSSITTQDMPLVECDCCRMGTRNPKPFGKYNRLCESCYLKAVKYPRLFQREPIVTKPKEYKPKETAEFRRARMTPGVSKMESAVLEELHKRGHKVEFQKEVCLEKTVVDFIVDGKPIYLDGKRVHQNREWSDDRIRERLSKILGEPVYAIPYDRFTKTAINEILTEIEGQ